MSVYRRKTTAGLTEEYHYRFMKSGKLYYGVCEGCTTEKAAKEYEAQIRQKADNLAAQKSVKALVENFRDELSGGEKIKLADAFELASKKPRKYSASAFHQSVKASQFDDFVRYMRKCYPDIKYISEVQKKHAEAYISHLRAHGRFYKQITFKNSTKKGKTESKYANKCEQLAPSTLNRFHKTIREVFGLLKEDAGLAANPFATIPMLSEDQESREAFTEKELELIMQKAPEFIRSIFLVGFFTALREGDIATLRWSDVLWEHNIIRRKLDKTGVIVEIPIMPPLENFLRQQEGLDPEYVLPEHARMYRENPSGIPYRVKGFLESIGIQTTRNIPGRSRAVSIKDVHSLRHTFCFFAGVAGIPLVVVQSIVGHMTPEMTTHYTAHADRKTKQEKMTMLPNYSRLIGETTRRNLVEQTRALLIAKIEAADDATLQKVASILLEKKPKRSPLRNTIPGKPIK